MKPDKNDKWIDQKTYLKKRNCHIIEIHIQSLSVECIDIFMYVFPS